MTKNFNYKLILRLLGVLLLVESFFILSSTFVSFIYNESDWKYFALSGAICIAFGLLGVLFGRNAPQEIGKREGTIIVSFIWIVFTLFGLLPFWLSKSIPNYTDAFFETMSGFTTTGASVLNDIESLSHGMLYWRSLTQWIGGLGIIVISLAVLPLFGFSGNQLFSAESTGPTKDKIHPKISETAKRLFVIYLGLTIAEVILLKIGGMNWFDAVCHSYTTVATGGFSTKQASIAYWNSPVIEYIIIMFMVLAGVNFSLFYFIGKRNFRKLLENEELKYYLLVIFGFAFIVSISLLDFSRITNFSTLETAFRDGLFHVSSMMTTTGYTTKDYMLWKPLVWFILILVMLVGASAGSTGGGIKMIRIVLVFKFCYYEFKRLIHPNAVIPVKYNQHVVKDGVMSQVMAFVVTYIILVFFGSLVLSLTGMGFLESLGGFVSSISCVGPGLGEVGPTGNYAHIPTFSKWFLSLFMLVGRLELFTVLLLFTPVFWKK